MNYEEIRDMLQAIADGTPPEGYSIRIGFETYVPTRDGSVLYQQRASDVFYGLPISEYYNERDAIIHCWQDCVKGYYGKKLQPLFIEQERTQHHDR